MQRNEVTGQEMELTPERSIEIQNASRVCPESVRPLRSVIVTEIMTGTRAPRTSSSSSMAWIAALALGSAMARWLSAFESWP